MPTLQASNRFSLLKLMFEVIKQMTEPYNLIIAPFPAYSFRWSLLIAGYNISRKKIVNAYRRSKNNCHMKTLP